MKRLFRRFSILLSGLLAVALAVFSLNVNSYAQDGNSSYECLIIDDANLLTEAQEEQVLYLMNKISEYGNVIFQSVTLTSGNYEKYSEDTYYSYFGNEPGVIFQIDMGNRKLTISSSAEFDDLIRDERDSIVDNIYKLASYSDYCGCACKCYDEIYAVLNDGKIAHTMKYIDNAILAVIVSLILNFILIFASGKKKASTRKIVKALEGEFKVSDVKVMEGKVTKKYSPVSSGSGGGSHGGGGGGGGGGFSGGSSSHGF